LGLALTLAIADKRWGHKLHFRPAFLATRTQEKGRGVGGRLGWCIVSEGLGGAIRSGKRAPPERSRQISLPVVRKKHRANGSEERERLLKRGGRWSTRREQKKEGVVAGRHKACRGMGMGSLRRLKIAIAIWKERWAARDPRTFDKGG